MSKPDGMSDALPPPEPITGTDSRTRSWIKDVNAGLINAIVSVPDGLASAALAGVNPVFGLYTSIVAPIAGSALASAQLMQIATTSASALVAGQAVMSYPAEQRAKAMFLLAVLVGVFLAIFGLLKLGRLVRFVSHAVMTGFLIGVAVVLILDQVAPLVGFEPSGANEVMQFADLLGHAAEFKAPTILIGLIALVLVFGLERTRLASLSSLAALIVPTMLIGVFGWESVMCVADVSPIPSGLPMPTLPDLSLLTLELTLSAIALAVVIAVQGAGVSQSVENPDESPISPSRDMVAQGAANIACGVFSGIPAGGSVGQTALNAAAGARSRWSGIFHGIWMLLIVLLIPGLIGRVPMAALAALMIHAGVSAIDGREARSIWHTGGAARWAILATFVATLVLSVPVAVAAGVILTVILYVASSANDVRVTALVRRDDGRIVESSPPANLPSGTVTILDVEGSLFFAGARTLAESFPAIRDAKQPVVILRLRGYTRVGATLIDVLDEYADDLAEAGGRLYLSGVHETIGKQLRSSRKLDLDKTVFVEPVDPMLGASTERAALSAREWLGSSKPGPSTNEKNPFIEPNK